MFLFPQANLQTHGTQKNTNALLNSYSMSNEFLLLRKNKKITALPEEKYACDCDACFWKSCVSSRGIRDKVGFL